MGIKENIVLEAAAMGLGINNLLLFLLSCARQ